MAWSQNSFDDGSMAKAMGRSAGAGVSMDPMTGALINAGSSVLGKALAPSSAGPSRADASQWLNQSWDNSGWTVSTGSSKAAGGARGLDLPPWMILGAVALVVVGWVRLKKS